MPPPQSQDTPKLFLDLFAGKHAPLTTAMEDMQADCLQPFDIESDPPFDILNDAHFRLAMRAAASGILGVLWSAPPCKEFSILKLRQPGPKALRTPACMDGLPTNTPAEQARVDASAEIHSRSRQVLRAAKETGSQTGMEQPPSSMAWHQRDSVTYLRDCCALPARCCLRAWHGLLQVAGRARIFSLYSQPRACAHAPGVHKNHSRPQA